MAVNSQVSNAAVIPLVLLVHLNSHQVRHNVGKSIIVVALDPHDFHAPLRIRELSDIAEETPVFFLKAPKVEIAENIAEENKAAKRDRPQHPQGSFGTAHFRP